jgi:ATP-binding cassette, subfamily C, bacterial LapB
MKKGTTVPMAFERDIWGDHASTERSTVTSRFLRDFRAIPSAATPSIVLASFISNVSAMALPFAVLIVYDRVVPNAAEHTLMLLMSGVVLALLMDALVRVARGQIVSHRASRYGHRAFMGMVSKTLFADPKAFQSVSAARRLEQIMAIDTLRESRAGYLPQLIIDFPFFLLFVAAVFLIGGVLGFVLLACIAILAISTWVNGQRVRKRVEERQDAERSQTNFLIEILQGLPTIKTYSMERLMVRRYERVIQRSAGVTKDVALGSGDAQAIANFVTQLTVATIVAFGSLIAIQGGMTIGGVAACMLLAGRAMQPLNRASLLWSQYQSVRIAKDHVKNFGQIPMAGPDRPYFLENFEGRIDLRNVAFRYDATHAVFENLSLTIRAGETVVIRGENWSGKSTLLALIAGIVKPDEGAVFYDGVDSTQLNDAALRRAVAYLSQHPVMFEGTLMENVCGFEMDADRTKDALLISEELGLTNAVSKLAKGFSTEISGTTMDSLPASLRQHIPIVRALSGAPKVVIMDECNSNLDHEADMKFREALERRKNSSTIIIVSQRPSFLALADRIIDLDDPSTVHADFDDMASERLDGQAPVLIEYSDAAHGKPDDPRAGDD